ncbi:MAG: DUF1145 domain-containing protein [Bermanella sp.]
MKNFFKMNIYGLMLFWLVFVVNIFMPLGETAGLWIMRIGVALLVAHALELAVVYKRLHKIDRTKPMDIVWVLLVGLFHWTPLLKK